MGTPASEMKNKIDGNVKKMRVREVLNLSDKAEKSYYQKYIGSICEGITEVRSDNRVIVYTSNFIPVLVSGNIDNNIKVRVKITGINDEGEVRGEIV